MTFQHQQPRGEQHHTVWRVLNDRARQIDERERERKREKEGRRDGEREREKEERERGNVNTAVISEELRRSVKTEDRRQQKKRGRGRSARGQGGQNWTSERSDNTGHLGISTVRQNRASEQGTFAHQSTSYPGQQ